MIFDFGHGGFCELYLRKFTYQNFKEYSMSGLLYDTLWNIHYKTYRWAFGLNKPTLDTVDRRMLQLDIRSPTDTK